MSIPKLAFFCLTMLFIKVTYGLKANHFTSPIARAAKADLPLLQRRGMGESTSLLCSHLSKDTMNSLTQRVEENNDMKNSSVQKDFALFTHDNVAVGYVSKKGIALLSNYPETFTITREFSSNDENVNIRLTPNLMKSTLADRSAAVEIATKDLKAKKIITGE